MVAPRVGGPSAIVKKQPKKPVANVEVEEVAGNLTLTPPIFFHKDYLPPRKDDTPPVNVLLNAKYPFPIAPVSVGISTDIDMLEKVANLKFMDHDIIDA
jgi:hypothetical protein